MQKLPVNFTDKMELTIPEFGSTPAQVLDISKIKEAEGRAVECRVVNPATYCDLEFTMNEAYREARKHLTSIGYQITLAKKAHRQAKSEALLDDYKDWLKESGLKDSACIRDAFLETQDSYTDAQDRIDMLTALEHYFEGKVKFFENVCRYMKKQMDLVRSSGMDPNKYVTL